MYKSRYPHASRAALHRSFTANRRYGPIATDAYAAVIVSGPKRSVVSTGRRNTCIKSFCWGFNSQSFTWPFVELTHHFV